MQVRQDDIAVECPIVGYYDRQRFKQFNPADCANWYLVENPLGKKNIAMYPTMGRRHINADGQNRLAFALEPRAIFKSVNYAYIVVGNVIFKVDRFYNVSNISQGQLQTISGDMFFAFLTTPAVDGSTVTFACFVDGQKIYIYREELDSFSIVTDPRAPSMPKFIAAFGNRIAVSQLNSSQFNLSEINLGASAFNAGTCFTVSGGAVFAQESGIIRQMGVLNNTLYIFTDYTTGIWSNIPSTFLSTGGTLTAFPWKKNTTTSWDYGISDPKSLAIGFGRIVWQSQNEDGLTQVVSSRGEQPSPISTKAIDLLFQRSVRLNVIGALSPFLNGQSDGFLYQWENTVFYRLSAGEYHNYGILDLQTSANSIEYNFDTETWHRVIEKNGERNRIQKHIFFNPNHIHLVTVLGESTVYEMSGQFYDNEISNPDRVDPQSVDAYIAEPFRYERVTPIIAEKDYGEFITDWVEIDFVWGENYNLFSESPFANAEFIIDEALTVTGEPVYIIADPDINGNPVYMLSETGDTPSINELTYNNLYKPHLELYWSDDGGVSFYPADVREFSELGVYQWRMRWYQLGASRNRCYKLVVVSPSPIVILGAIQMKRRVSGGSD